MRQPPPELGYLWLLFVLISAVFFIYVSNKFVAACDRIEAIYKHLGLDKTSQPSTSKEK